MSPFSSAALVFGPPASSGHEGELDRTRGARRRRWRWRRHRRTRRRRGPARPHRRRAGGTGCFSRGSPSIGWFGDRGDRHGFCAGGHVSLAQPAGRHHATARGPARPRCSSDRSATRSAPAKIWAWSLTDRPSMMKRPRPPAPTKAAMVAVATTCTAAVRTPAISSGAATGQLDPAEHLARRTCPCRGRRRAGRRAPRRRRRSALVTSGGTASATRARNVVNEPMTGYSRSPNACVPMHEDGEARDGPADVGDVDGHRAEPALVAEPHRQRQGEQAGGEGGDRRHAHVLRAAGGRCRGRPTSCLLSREPVDDLAEEVHRAAAPGAGPRGEEALHQAEEQVGRDGEGDRQDDADGDGRADRPVLADVDQVAEARDGEEAGHGGEADDGDRGDADARHDRGQGQRQLDAEEAAHRREAHAVGGVLHLGAAPRRARRRRSAPGSAACS